MTPTAAPPAPATYTPPPGPAALPVPPPTTPPVPTLPPSASGWGRFRWTTAEYRELGKLDHFRDIKTMLIDGEVYTMSLPKPPHDIALNLADAYLKAICPPGHHVRNQQAFNIGTRTDPGPDLAVVPRSIRDAATTPTTAALVVEIAHTTLFDDTTKKAEVYATAGVPDYWVVDVEGRKLLVYRDPAPLPEGLGATAYRSHAEYGPDDAVAPLAAPDKPVKLADLLP